MKRIHTILTFAVALVLLAGCDSFPTNSEPATEVMLAEAQDASNSYTFASSVFDIAAAPDGSILVAENGTVKEIRKGDVTAVIDIPLPSTSPPTNLNGLVTIGRGSFFATTGGGDGARGAKLWRVSRGNARIVANITEFEIEHDPDAAMWKAPACEVPTPPGDLYDEGPQSNPFHLTRLSGSTALVADAAGNALLRVKTNGEIELVAVFTPPVADGSSSDDPSDWLVLFELKDGTDCYVQPVPTSVAIGPDGAYYVGELTGAVAEGLPTGLSRVWRIEPGARNVVCPSEDCQAVISELTSVIDLAFGPEGKLYVVEYDENSWIAPFIPFIAGGTISRCDVNVDPATCDDIATNLMLPGAITFDKWGNLWVLENNIGFSTKDIEFTDNTGAPTVHRVGLP